MSGNRLNRPAFAGSVLDPVYTPVVPEDDLTQCTFLKRAALNCSYRQNAVVFYSAIVTCARLF